MTSSHQGELFDIEPDHTADDQPVTTGRVGDVPSASKTDEVSKDRLDEMADKLGNYVLARASLGLPLDDETADEATAKRHLPGRAPSYPKRGNVRDFHDGGRADEFRGGIGAPELGSEADDALRRSLPELQAQRDRVVEENIREGFEEDVIASEYIKVDAARSRALSRYRGHVKRHYPDMSDADVNDLLADFAETLLPPSPLR